MYPLNFKISPPPPTAATAATPARAHFITFISDWWHFIHSSSLAILHWAARCCENVNSTLKKIQTEKKYLSIWQVLSSQSSHYLAQTKPGRRFWSTLSISKPLLNNSMYVWRMENASVLHFIHLAVCIRAGHSSSNTTFYLQNSSNFSENLLIGRSRRPGQHQLFCLSLNISLAPLCLST